MFKWTDAKGVVHYGDRPPATKAGNPASAACFSRHRVADGKGVTAAGQAYCTEVPQPTCAR